MEIEFYTFEQEVWYRSQDGTHNKLCESSSDIIDYMLDKIESFYPGAYEALCKEYDRCKPNIRYFRFRIVQRFCKCNFGAIDNIPDVNKGRFNFECVGCPLRGECQHEGVVCRPKFNHRLSDGEIRVLRLLYQGQSREDIAKSLYLSIHTVNNHIHNAFARLDLHSVAEFMKWASQSNIFSNEI